MALFAEKNWFVAILVVAVCVIVVAAHWPVFSAKALWFDDNQYFIDNVLVQNPGWAATKQFFCEVFEPSTVKGYYQPLSMISLMLDYAVGGRESDLRPFHMTSLALHTMNTALIIILLYLLFNNTWAAAAAGLLFGVHPMTIESITWVSERKTLLAAFFSLWSLILYVLYSRRGGWKSYAGCFLMYLLSLLSKPTSVPLPVVMLLMDYWPLKRFNIKCVLEKVPLFTLSAVFAVITCISQTRAAAKMLLIQFEPERAPLVICHNIVFYLYKIILPINLMPHYPFPKPFNFSNIMVLAGFIGTCLLIYVLVISLRWTRAVLTGLLIFFVVIFPAMGVVRFTNSIVADRFAYLPAVGLLMTMTSFLIWLCGNKRTAIIVAMIVLVVAGAQTFTTQRYLKYWKDTITLAKYAMSLSPNSAEVCNMLACAYDSLGRYEDEIEVCQKAIKTNPTYIDLYDNLGTALGRLGRYQEAIQAFRRAIQLNTDLSEAHLGLGAAYLMAGDKNSAVKEYEILKSLDPQKANLLLNLFNQQK